MLVIKSSTLVLVLLLQSNLFLQGLAEFRDGNYQAAESSLAKALKNQDDPRARVFLALTRAAVGRCEKALPDLKKYLAESENSDIRRLTGLATAQCEMSAHRFGPAMGILDQLN